MKYLGNPRGVKSIDGWFTKIKIKIMMQGSWMRGQLEKKMCTLFASCSLHAYSFSHLCVTYIDIKTDLIFVWIRQGIPQNLQMKTRCWLEVTVHLGRCSGRSDGSTTSDRPEQAAPIWSYDGTKGPQAFKCRVCVYVCMSVCVVWVCMCVCVWYIRS